MPPARCTPSFSCAEARPATALRRADSGGVAWAGSAQVSAARSRAGAARAGNGSARTAHARQTIGIARRADQAGAHRATPVRAGPAAADTGTGAGAHRAHAVMAPVRGAGACGRRQSPADGTEPDPASRRWLRRRAHPWAGHEVARDGRMQLEYTASTGGKPCRPGAPLVAGARFRSSCGRARRRPASSRRPRRRRRA